MRYLQPQDCNCHSKPRTTDYHVIDLKPRWLPMNAPTSWYQVLVTCDHHLVPTYRRQSSGRQSLYKITLLEDSFVSGLIYSLAPFKDIVWLTATQGYWWHRPMDKCFDSLSCIIGVPKSQGCLSMCSTNHTRQGNLLMAGVLTDYLFKRTCKRPHPQFGPFRNDGRKLLGDTNYRDAQPTLRYATAFVPIIDN